MRQRTLLFCAVVASAVSLATVPQKPASANATSIDLPPPALTFNEGPNVSLARSRCLTCHDTNYVYTQPPLTRAQWTAEVNKMKNVFAAPIAQAEVVPLVDYLMSQNGKP